MATSMIGSFLTSTVATGGGGTTAGGVTTTVAAVFLAASVAGDDGDADDLLTVDDALPPMLCFHTTMTEAVAGSGWHFRVPCLARFRCRLP